MPGISRRDFVKGAAVVGGAAATAAHLGWPLSAFAGEARISAAGAECPIEHIVVLTMENRSFDHYFGALSLLEGRSDVDGLTGNESNDWSDGTRVPVFDLGGRTCARLDPPHEWAASRTQFNDGTNDGYLRAMEDGHPETASEASRPPDGDTVMGFYQRRDLPFAYGAADKFAICQRYFSPVGGPTLPNRHYLHCATSEGLKDNHLDSRGPGAGPSPMGDPTYGFDFTTIYERMSDQRPDLDWRVYFVEAPFTMLYRWPRLTHPERFRPYAQFLSDAATGNLASYTTIDPGYFTASDHAPQNVHLGQLFIASVYYALATSPAWDKTALFVTYDEDGGFYDHVPHRRGLADSRADAADIDEDFGKSGGRLPTMVLGPWVKEHYVSDVEADHTSILAFAEWRFGLEPLTARDAGRLAAGQHLLDCFDFGRSAPRQPEILPVPSFQATMFTDCGSTYVAPSFPFVPGPREPGNPRLDLNDALMTAIKAGAIPMLDPATTRRTLTDAFHLATEASNGTLLPRPKRPR